MQSILSLFGRHRPSTQEEQEEIKCLHTLVETIFERFFGRLVRQYATSKQLAEDDAKKEPLGLFEKVIAEGLKTEHPTAAQALQARFHAKRYHNDEQCQLFRSQLEKLFSYDYDLENNLEKMARVQVTVYKEILTLITCALQGTVFGIPKIMYSGTEQVPDKDKNRLTDILKYIDAIKLRYKLQAPLLDLSNAVIRLCQEIAQVDGYAFLPLNR